MSTKQQTSPTSGKNKIVYQCGARLEAMDYTLSWYSAKICRVDEKERKVLIHFEGWNHRYDEWIAFDSERLRAHARQHSVQDSKDEKEVCDYQDWKVGDRVLAKWQDCKFYPARVLKCLNDGAYEVLFYDGIKKVLHRVNIKPDTRKVATMPMDKMEHEREVQERKERRQLMANARAERARKRSAEISPVPPVVPVKRKDGRGRKGRTQERDEFGTASESSVSSPSGEVDEVLQDSEKMDIKDEEGEPQEAGQYTRAVESVSEDVKGNDHEKPSEEENVTERTFTHITEQATPVELEQEHDSSLDSVSEIEKDDSSVLKTEKGRATESHNSYEQAMPFKEELKGDSPWNVNTRENSELSIQNEETSNSSEESTLNITENVNTEPLDMSKGMEEQVGKPDVVANEGSSGVMDLKLESQNTFPSLEENESSNDASICDSNTSSELHQEQHESLEVVTVTPKLERDATVVDSKPSDYVTHKMKTSKGPKIKRTLSRAERLSRNRKAKSGLTLKMGFKASPLKVSLPSKQADSPGVSVPPKGAPPVKGSIKSEKTVQRRRSSKGSRTSSISPRGYGYSMAFMDIEKPGGPVVKTEPETQESIPDSGLTDALKISTQSITATAPSPTSPASSTGTPTENLAPPKKQTYQAKKFRLDQITGKLSAQRQSEAQAAAHSPSAFQLAKHHSSPPPLSPSPPAKPPPPYPREPYPPPGPPPLIYSPMPGSCCPTPHHQHMYGPHPGHGMHLPGGHMHPHPEYPPPPPSTGYMLYTHGMHYPPPPGPCIGQCSCSAGVRQPVYRPLPPGAPPPPPPTRDSALAQLMQCEQRILHGAPGMPHFREAAPPGPWVTHRHGPPPTQPFIPVGRHPEERWLAHEERALQVPPVSQAPPPPSSISPTLESGKNASRRSRKSERPLPTKALPASMLPVTEASSAPATKIDQENFLTVDKGTTQQSESEATNMTEPKPKISDLSTTDVPKSKLESESNSAAPIRQGQTISDQKEASVISSAGVSGGGMLAVETTVGAEPGTPSQESMMSVSSLLPANKDSFPFQSCKGKELAPKELIIEIDHNKHKCKVPGCDKSFRKESGLEYHIKYYHEQQAGIKRKKSVSVRSDSTPETSPEFGSRRVTKRRIHRSSAPAQLTTSTQPTSPVSVTEPATTNSKPIEPETSELLRSVSMDSEPSVHQDIDLEIEGGGVELESIDPGMVEAMEVEEEEDVNGDVIRCLCNEIEEGGFMIQCEQCLTWQHSECVGLSEQTVPPNYLCYVCSNPRGLRRSAKYKNDFDWFRRGTLACMPFVSIEEPEYTAELNLATHGLMGDLHDVNNCLRSLKLKFELLRNPSHPDLKYWRRPKTSNLTAAVSDVDESSALSLTNTENMAENSSTSTLNEQGEGSKPVSAGSNGHAVINGHAEMGHTAQNGLISVKQERPSTPPPSLDGPGDSNNNIQDKKAPQSTNTGAMSLLTVPGSSSVSRGTFGANTASGESSDGSLNVVKTEEPLSPIPALVPAGGQAAYVKNAPPADQDKREATLDAKSDSTQLSVKSSGDKQETGQSIDVNSSVGSSEVKPNPSVGSPKADSAEVKVPSGESKPQLASDVRIKQEPNPSVGSPKADSAEVKVPSGESKPQLASDVRIKQENDLKTSAQSGVATVSEVKEEMQEESVSEDEGVESMNNLLGDVAQIQDDLEERMDEIERQLTVLEEAYGGTPTQLTKKTDFRKLVKDLSRVRRLLQQVS